MVGDGAQAIQAVQQHDYDLRPHGLQMPVMDGIEATKTIRSLDGAVRHMPIIAMTANVYAEQIASFRLAGMDDHVGKPFKREELFDTIERWLPRSRAPFAERRRPHSCRDARPEAGAPGRRIPARPCRCQAPSVIEITDGRRFAELRLGGPVRTARVRLLTERHGLPMTPGV